MSMGSKGSLLCLLSFFVFAFSPGSGVAQPLAESTFDAGTGGWTTNGKGTPPQHVSSGGRPGGYIEAQSQNAGEIWYWGAPSSFTGDFSAAYNGALRFELTQDTTNTLLDSTDVILEGANRTLVFAVASPPNSRWTPYRVPLRPDAGWSVQSTGDVPTPSQMKEVLGSLQGLRIRGNFWSGSGGTGLDNVRLQAAQTIERWVDPSQTYLRTDQDNARDAVAINLANLGLDSGDQIHVAHAGEFDFDPTEENTTKSVLVAVFSGSDVLENSDQRNRVSDAIDAGEDFQTLPTLTDKPTDIPEDFLVDGGVVEIPQGATHLFLSPDDSKFGDNTDPDGDFKLRITLPHPPSGLTATASGDSVALDWNAPSSTSLVEYRIYRDTAPIDSTGGPGRYSAVADTTAETTTYIDESVSVGETYHYRITAVDSAGNESSFSKEILATPGPIPSPPSNVRASVEGDSSAVVQWQAVADAEKYRLYRDTASIGTSNGPNSRSPLDSTSAGDTTYVETSLVPGQTYHYRLTSVDADANESDFSTEVTARPPLSVVATPDSKRVAQADTATVNVLANDVQGRAPLDTTSFRVNVDPEHGTATVNRNTGTLDYAHDGTANFQDDLSYIVKDADGAADTARVVLSVAKVAVATERDSVDLGGGQVATRGPSVRLDFASTGDTSATGLSLTLSNETDYSVLSDTGEETLPPGSTRTVRVGFRPDTVGAGQTTSVTLATETGLEWTVFLTGDGVGAQVETSAEGGAASRGEPVTVNVTPQPQGPFEPTSRRLYARPGGGQYQEMADSSKIPGSLVTRKGLDYYVVLTEGDLQVVVPGGTKAAARKNPFHLPVQFDSLSAPISLTSSAYRMVTVPARTPVNEALENSYGKYDPSTWRMLRWDPTAGEGGDYREFPDLDSVRAGMGFWLITSEGTSFTLGTGRTVDASTAKRIPLKPGWNQIGSPFGFAVPWDTVQATSGLSGTEIDGPVGYRESSGYQPDRSVLKPWEGYFVFNATGGRDTLVVPPVGTGSGKALRAEAGPTALSESRLWRAGHGQPVASQSASANASASPSAQSSSASVQREVTPQADQSVRTEPKTASISGSTRTSTARAKRATETPYTLRVAARPRGGQPHRVWLGLRSEARTGRDALDFAQAPPVGRTVRLSVLETIGGRSVPHAGSFKPPEGAGRAWTLVLERRSDGRAEQNGSTREVRLLLRAEGTPPEGQKRYLLDLDAERRVAPGQTLALEPGERRHLKVIVGTEAFAQKESSGISLGRFENELRGNVPNPFGEETTLTYVLEEKTEVTLEIYNVLGQRVRTLVQGARQPGVHHVRWNGENRYGEPVGSGVYFYRINAGDFRKTRKMVLVR